MKARGRPLHRDFSKQDLLTNDLGIPTSTNKESLGPSSVLVWTRNTDLRILEPTVCWVGKLLAASKTDAQTG